MFITMVYIAGFYINPLQVMALIPTNKEQSCEIRMTSPYLVREVPLKCAQVAEIIHTQQKTKR